MLNVLMYMPFRNTKSNIAVWSDALPLRDMEHDN